MNQWVKILIFIFTVLLLVVSIVYCLVVIYLIYGGGAPEKYLGYFFLLLLVCIANLVMYLSFFLRKQNYLIVYIDIIFVILGIVAIFGKLVTLYGSPWFIAGILNTIIANEQPINDDIPDTLN